MNSTLKNLTVLASSSVAFFAVASSASAITLVQTQTFDFDPSGEIATVWNRSAEVSKYLPGGLVKVEVELSGTATSDLSATTTTIAEAEILSPSTLGAQISSSSPLIPSLNIDVLPVSDISPLSIAHVEFQKTVEEIGITDCTSINLISNRSFDLDIRAYF